MATLRSEGTRGTLRGAKEGEMSKPIPLSPVLTAIRSLCPTLRWAGVPRAQEYKVRVADKDDKCVWEGSTRTQTQVALPSGVLRRGQVYFWQVEAIVEGQSHLSPAAGFWVLSERELHEVEKAEQKYKGSTLVRASMYAAHGLYEEALERVEILMGMNPTSPLVQAILYNLRRQLGKEE